MQTALSFRLRAALVLVALSTAAGALPATAEPNATARAEIDYLLEFILESSCRFVRNGRDYDAARAHSHVMRKFEYFEDEIATAEDFIEHSASRSTMSGKPYQFVCGGEARNSAEVLREELTRFRSARETG